MTNPICLGDATSSGGTVVSCQLEGTHTLKGKTPAVLGDKATCPLHLGEFAFVEGHPRRRMNGIPLVLQGWRAMPRMCRWPRPKHRGISLLRGGWWLQFVTKKPTLMSAFLWAFSALKAADDSGLEVGVKAIRIGFVNSAHRLVTGHRFQ
jgi:uncharacterized Zn-binding protein involved in type VI secretion